VFKDLISERAVRSLATSILTAAIIAGVDATFFKPEMADAADKATTIGDHISNVVADLPGAIQQGVVHGTISGAVDTAINGGDLGQNLLSGMQGAVVAEIGESVANEIGLAAKNGDINKASRYIAHAALGAGMDLATGGDGVSGAVGAVVGEATAELYLAQYVDQKLRSEEVGKMTPAQFQEEVAYLKGLGANLSALSAGIAAAALGGDPNAAAATGKNAAQNNELITLSIAAALVALEIADKAITAYDAWELAQAISEGDGEKVEAKALEIGAGLATDAIPGNVVMIKLGKALHVLGLGTVGTKIVAKVGGKVDDVAGVVEHYVSFSDKQLQKKFKHADVFGIVGNYNQENVLRFKSAIENHVNSPNVVRITGTYRGDSVVHFVDKATGLNVITKQNGDFISAWRLGEEQLKNVISRGSL